VLQENLQAIQSIYEAVSRRDWDAAFRHQAPDIELTTPPGPNGGTYRGREEVQRFWEEMLMPFEEVSAEPKELFVSGDQVAVIVKGRLRPKGSSAEIELRNGHLWTFRDGKARSMRMFPSPQEALEAAGLRA